MDTILIRYADEFLYLVRWGKYSVQPWSTVCGYFAVCRLKAYVHHRGINLQQCDQIWIQRLCGNNLIVTFHTRTHTYIQTSCETGCAGSPDLYNHFPHPPIRALLLRADGTDSVIWGYDAALGFVVAFLKEYFYQPTFHCCGESVCRDCSWWIGVSGCYILC